MDDTKNLGYVPATDDKGIRKTFPTPEFKETRGTQAKYPWHTIPVGECFEVLYSDMSKKSIHPYVSKMGKKLGKKFKVIDKPEFNLWLVAHLPMDEASSIATSSNVVEAMGKMDKDETET